MSEHYEEKLDQACTEIAVLCATVGEMSKRLSDQASSIRTLNDSHHDTEVKLTEIIGEHNALSFRIGKIEDGITELKNIFSNSWKVPLTVATFILAIFTFIINYLLN